MPSNATYSTLLLSFLAPFFVAFFLLHKKTLCTIVQSFLLKPNKLKFCINILIGRLWVNRWKKYISFVDLDHWQEQNIIMKIRETVTVGSNLHMTEIRQFWGFGSQVVNVRSRFVNSSLFAMQNDFYVSSFGTRYLRRGCYWTCSRHSTPCHGIIGLETP